MIFVNLLPWREEQNKLRQKIFLGFSGVAFLVGLSISGLVYLSVAHQIAAQELRNDFLRGEISRLDNEIAKIDGIKETKQQISDRIDIIRDLQSLRPLVVQLFSDLVDSVPDGIRLLELSQSGSMVTVRGESDSNVTVSRMMDSIKSKEILGDPSLDVIRRSKDGYSEFVMRFKILGYSQDQVKR